MFKSAGEQLMVLGVCVDEPAMVGRTQGLDFCSVRSGRRGIDMLRMLSFDLVMVGMEIPDINVWDFVKRVRTGWAWQKWALVGGMISEEQEITARIYGAVRIYDLMPSGEEVLQLAGRLRERSSPTVINKKFEQGGGDYRSAAAF